ncbi:MAG: DUF378 domain-containing protein [Clostridiales bacterium]|nr:DUF378 domain-containing protein [Clostridiales bacterium]
MRTKPLDWSALALAVIGAINWGLVGFFRFDLIAAIFGGSTSWVSRIIYALIGLAGLYSLSLFAKMGQDRNNNVVYEGHQHTETESFDR